MLEFQLDKPVFVRSRYFDFTWGAQTYKYNQHVPWLEIGVPEDTIRLLFKADKLYHNQDLEVKHEVGDRLAELNWAELNKLADALNAQVKKRTKSTTEYNKYKVRKSTGRSEQKQRGLLRTWRNNHLDWAEEIFREERDKIMAARKDVIEEAAEDTTDVEEQPSAVTE